MKSFHTSIVHQYQLRYILATRSRVRLLVVLLCYILILILYGLSNAAIFHIVIAVLGTRMSMSNFEGAHDFLIRDSYFIHNGKKETFNEGKRTFEKTVLKTDCRAPN